MGKLEIPIETIVMMTIEKISKQEDFLSFELKNARFVFRRIKAAEFVMGATDFRKDTLPPHKVVISHDYWMQETLVTQLQWHQLGGTSIAEMIKETEFDSFNGLGDNYPIYFVSWNEAVEFCNKLTTALKDYGLKASLPTEAEWEYACRCGSYLPYSFGDTCDGTQANCNGKFPYGQGKVGIWKEEATPVYSYKPNPFGLYDMHGNMWEWCNDWYSETYYKDSPVVDPKGPEFGVNKVVRGGSWRSHAECCRSAFRDQDAPDYRGRSAGFRITLKAK